MLTTVEKNMATQAAAGASHPLDPLSAEEIIAAASIIRAAHDFGADLRFETIELCEPAKDVVREFAAGMPIERVARFNIYKRGATGVWRGKVSLTEGKITTDDFLPDVKPMISPEEFFLIEAAAKADPRFITAIERRGIKDMSLVCVDPWPAGNFGFESEKNRRLSHTFVWMRMFELDNYYAHPIEGINAVVDIDTMEVLRVDDHTAGTGADVPIPEGLINYDSKILTDYREPLKPLDVVQSEGPSFTLEGNLLSWDNWDVRIGFNGREGLVLHRLGYSIDGKRRPVGYRLSMAEMVVPYGTPEGVHYRKNVFDSGEYGFGKLVNSLALGCDCLGHIQYMDVVLPDMTGNPRVIPSGICIHEEDAGLAWKHFDFRSDRTETRRTRRLVISSITTVGNYEYCCYWYLFQDGRIEFEMKATGVINTVACFPGSEQKYGTEVAPGVVGYNHQHVFCMRMDMEIDGPNNTVIECDTVAPAMGPGNEMGNAFYVEQTPLTSELKAQRKVDFEKSRYWKIVNPDVKNWVGKPTGYKIETPSAIQPYIQPEGPSGSRSGFIYNHLWVTPYDPEERFPAGEFVNHSMPGEGLPAWTAKDRPTENTDIVLWHSFGLHHIPRLEDHPVQPCVFCGFTLMPLNFFDGNPLINLPPETNMASKSHGKDGGSCCGAK